MGCNPPEWHQVGSAVVSMNDDKRAAFRYDIDAAVHGRIGDREFDARLRDVSATGAAVVGLGDVGYDNNQFVDLHMEGLGHRTGYVRRQIPGGFAFQFDGDDEEEARKLEAAAKFRVYGRAGLNA